MAAPLSSGIKNWHWRQKTVDKWAYDWFKTQLPNVSATDATGLVVKVTGVTAIEGDVTVGQRKSKLITIYDLDMTLSWTATSSDGTETTGTLRIPEVSHEAIDGISNYVFDFSSTSTSSESYQSVKKLLPPPLKDVFTLFQQTLIDVHGKDLLVVDAPTPSDSGASTPATPAAAPAAAAVEKAGGVAKAAAPTVNTSTVKVEGRFQISAADLWSLLTDERKIPQWSRSPAQFSATPSAPFSLFSGGVQGTIESVNAPSQLVMSWALKSSPSWPKDHYGTLTITLEQGSDSTGATFTLTGVPKGQERELENNLHAFYVRGFVSMGLVSTTSVSSSIRTSTSSSLATSSPLAASAKSRQKKSPSSSTSSSSRKKSARSGSGAKGGAGGPPLLGIAVVGGLVVVLGGIVWLGSDLSAGMSM